MRRLSETGGWPVWWPDGKQLGYQDLGKNGSTEFRIVPFSGGPSKILPSLQLGGANHPFDVSSDGASLATATSETISSDIWLLRPQRSVR